MRINLIFNKGDNNSFNVDILTKRKTDEPKEVNSVTRQEEVKWSLNSGCSDYIINTDNFAVGRKLENPININKIGDGVSFK